MAAVQYGVLPQIPDVLSSLMCAETNIEDACRDLLQMLASPLAEKSPSHVQSLLHHQGPLAGKGSSHIPFLYDQGPLAGKCSPSLTYSIKRLLRGLAAISLHTKTNYASALFCILSHFKDTLDAKVIVTWAKGALQKNKEYAEHRLSTTEENALLAGRLITYSIFVAVLPLDLEDLLELLSDSYRIWTDHDHLCTLAISSISDIITYADQRARPLQLLTSLLPKCKCQIKKSTLIMTIRSLFDADFADDYELNLSDVSVRLSLLNEIDMDRIDSPKNYALFRSLMIFETSTVDMHETCWTEITSKLLCTPKPGIPLLQNLLDDLLYLKSAHFDQLLTESVLEGLVKDQQFTVRRFLNIRINMLVNLNF